VAGEGVGGFEREALEGSFESGEWFWQDEYGGRECGDLAHAPLAGEFGGMYGWCVSTGGRRSVAASAEDDQWVGRRGEWFLDQGWRDPLCISQEGGWSGVGEPVYWVLGEQS